MWIYVANFPIDYSFNECAEMLELQSRTKSSKSLLYDHRPLELNADDYQRVCRIPKKKVFVYHNLTFICHYIVLLFVSLIF